MFFLVGDQVAQGEAVVAGHEVDAVRGTGAGAVVQVGTADNAGHEFFDDAGVALEKTPHGIAVGAVPTGKSVTGKIANQVQAAGVPGLGNQAGAGQNRVGVDGPQDRWSGQGLAVFIPGHGRREVKTETVDVQRSHPVTQRVGDQTLGHRMVGVERVAAAGEIPVQGKVFVLHVISGFIKAAPAQGGAIRARLGGVVVDHIENDAQAGGVQGAHHVAKFVDDVGGGVGGCESGVWCEEGNRAVAPVVGAACRRILHVEGVHGHQLNGGDTQLHQMIDAGGESGVGAAQVLRHATGG